MGAETFQSFIKLIRLDYSFFAALNVLLAGILAQDLLAFQSEYFFAFSIVFLTAAGAFAFNDYCDFEADKINSRDDRPLVSGKLDRSVALMIALASASLIILVALLLNPWARSFVLVSFPLFFVYSLCLKRMIFVKNVVIAYAFVATILLGSLVSDSAIEPLIAYFAAMGFIVGLGFEIMLDMGDVDGDREIGVETLSTKYGLRTAAKVSVLLYGLIMILDPLPFLVMIDPRLYLDYVFLLLILIPVASYFSVSKALMRNQSISSIFLLKKKVFLTMQVGCVAYLIGVLL